jgi:hypothetical protein
LYSVLIELVLCGSEQHNWLINNFRSTVGQFRDVAFAPCGYTVWIAKMSMFSLCIPLSSLILLVWTSDRYWHVRLLLSRE